MTIPIISDLLEKLFGPADDPHSRDDVKRRLKIVLAHDRLALDPQTLEMMRQEIIAVVSRYVEVDFENLEFSLATDQRVTALTANLPIRRIRPLGKEPDQPIESASEAETIELASKSEIMAMDAENAAAALRQFEQNSQANSPRTPSQKELSDSSEREKGETGTTSEVTDNLIDIDPSRLGDSDEADEELTLDLEGDLADDELVGEPAPQLPDLSVPDMSVSDVARTLAQADESGKA
ncbi:MAG: cell division topological specificity factor MinE [Phormidesmis sp.]